MCVCVCFELIPSRKTPALQIKIHINHRVCADCRRPAAARFIKVSLLDHCNKLNQTALCLAPRLLTIGLSCVNFLMWCSGDNELLLVSVSMCRYFPPALHIMEDMHPLKQ